MDTSFFYLSQRSNCDLNCVHEAHHTTHEEQFEDYKKTNLFKDNYFCTRKINKSILNIFIALTISSSASFWSFKCVTCINVQLQCKYMYEYNLLSLQTI